MLGVTHFGDLVPEVMYFGEEYENKLLALIDMRINYKLKKYRKNKTAGEVKKEILRSKRPGRSI